MIWLWVIAGYIVVAAAIFGAAHVVLVKLDTDYDPAWPTDVCFVAVLCLAWGIALPVAIIAGIVASPFLAAYIIARKILNAQEK